MGWFFAKQPNGKLARFSDIVDNFTHYDMSEDEALAYCLDDMGRKQAKEDYKIPALVEAAPVQESLPVVPFLNPREAMVAAGLIKETVAPAKEEAAALAPARAPEVIALLPEPVAPIPMPPKRKPRIRGICGKLCFGSRKAARAGNSTARFRFRAYFCKQCRAWHVANGDK